MTETDSRTERHIAKWIRETALEIVELSKTLVRHFVSWRLMKISFSSLALVLILGILLVLGLEIWKRVPTMATYGVIIVESPEVYTRERLVNDRLRETAWLERQLQVTENGLKKNSDFTTVEATLLGANHLGVRAAVATGAEENESGNADETAAAGDQGAAKGAVGPTTMELFRAMSNFRDEVRAEIMRTQLDDRHDIEGNTLYRLIFDTTVLPGDNTEAWAIVHVRLKSDESFMEDDESLGDELFEDWHDYVERIVNDAAAAIFREVWTRHLSQRSVRSLFDLQDELRRQITLTLENHGLETLGLEREGSTEKLLRDFSDTYIETLQDSLKNRYMAKAGAILDAAEKQRRAENGDMNAWPELQPYETIDEGCVTGRWRVTDGRFRWRYGQGKEDFVELPCPSQLRRDFERFFATMHVYHFVRDLVQEPTPGAHPSLYERLIDWCEADDDGTAMQCQLGAPPSEWHARCTVVELYIELLRDRFEPYFDLRIAGDDLQNCKVALDEKMEDQAGNKVVGPEAKYREDVKKVGREQFFHKLQHSPVEAFSYGVTPRNLVQRISASLTATISASLGAATGGLSPTSGGAGEGQDNTKALFDLLSQTSRDVQAIENRPIVVGYGWSGKLVETPSPGRETEFEKTRALSPNADFGWMIGPRLNVSSELGNKPYTHVAGQYPLSAVISVPSWWRRLNLDVTTCWVSPSKIDAELDDPLRACEGAWFTPGRLLTQLQIKLPGSEEEISRLFRFDVIDFPFLTFERTKRQTQALRAGRPGDIVIQGQRLWRSTVVTLGAQMADEIRVLPNMEGIIATFNCVERPEGWMRRPLEHGDGGSGDRNSQSNGIPRNEMLQLYTTVPLRVWTSEGQTEPPMEVGIFVTPDTDGPNDIVCEGDERNWANKPAGSE